MIFANSFRLFGHRLANLTDNNNLDGTIPKEIGSLTNLEGLYLCKYMVLSLVLMQTLDERYLLTLFLCLVFVLESYGVPALSMGPFLPEVGLLC
jgi:hypothetical protein